MVDMGGLECKAPRRAHIELSSRCNFKCLTCRHGFVDYGQDIDDEVCDILISDVIPYLDEVELQGTGESLISHNFDKVFDAVVKNDNCRICLITNGSLITEELAWKFARANMQLIYSLDGPNEEIFSAQRPVGDFKNIENNIAMIRDIKHRVPRSLLVTVINMVLTRYNMFSVMEMVDFASDMEVECLFVSEVRECMPDKTVWENLRLDNYGERHELYQQLALAKKYALEKGIAFYFNPYSDSMVVRKAACPSPWQHVFISAGGDLSFCCELNSFFGNIKETSFHDVWNGQAANNFRSQMLLNCYHKSCLSCCLSWGIMRE